MPRYKKVAAKHKVTKYYISAKTNEYMKINFVILLVCATAFFLPDAFAEIKVETVVDGLKYPGSWFLHQMIQSTLLKEMEICGKLNLMDH